MDILELLKNPIADLVVGMAFSLVLALVFYLKGKRDKEPHWSIQTVNLFKDYSGTVAGLDIQYLGDKVRDLSVSKIAFWNHGALTIDLADLVPADRLRLEARGKGRILSTKLISTNNKASQPLLSASLEKDQAFLQFEYLDRGQGFVIQVIHEGTSSNDLDLKGAIKGVTRIRKIDLDEFINKTKAGRSKHLFIQFAVYGLILVPLVPLFFYAGWREGGYLAPVFWVMGLLVFAAMINSGKLLLARRQVPPGLEAFYTDPRQPGT
jgi:hypothetical protein